MHLYVAGKQDTDADGALLHGNEPWRFCKSFGSLLCSTADIAHRIALDQAAFQTYTVKPRFTGPLGRKGKGPVNRGTW